MAKTPQLRVRSYAGDEDASLVAALLNASREADDVRSPLTAEAIKAFLEDAGASTDPSSDVHLFFLGHELIGYERTRRESWADGTRVYHIMPFIHPDRRDPDHLAAVVERICRYQSEYAQSDPEGAGAFLSAMHGADDKDDIEALTVAGFAPRHFFFQMSCTLDARPEELDLPADLEIRPTGEEDFRSIYEFDRHIMAGSWGIEAPTEEHFAWWSEEAFRNPELWHVAWHGNEIVATAAGAIGGTWNPRLGGEKGEIRFVRVASSRRREGIATALVSRSLASLWDTGVRKVFLGVDGTNEDSAVTLYRKLGFVIDSRLTAFCRDASETSASSLHS